MRVGLILFLDMDAGQRTEFLGRAYAVRVALRPLTIGYKQETIEASGSVAGRSRVELQSGGRKTNREATFSILKSVRAEALPLGAVVEIDGVKFQVSRAWGDDPTAVAWTYWVEQWTT